VILEFSGDAFFCFSLPILLIILWLLRRKHSPAGLFFLAAFGVYLLFLVAMTLLPIDFSVDYHAIMRDEVRFSDRMNLIPFYFGPFSSLWQNRYALLANILLTVPFGFGIGFVAGVHPRDLRWLPWAVGFGIEGAQLGIGLLLGYPYRVVDINDVIMNALGVAVGFGLFWLQARGMLWLAGHFSRRPNGLAREMVRVAERSLRG
jgi:glycopeptide antibiotics resistance protein